MTRVRSDKHKILFGSHLFKNLQGSYLERTSRPIYALMYLLGFVVVYEFGVFLMSPDILTRPLNEIPGLVVAFAWMHGSLTWFGLSNKFAWMGTPFIFVIVLVAMQFTNKSSFKVKPKDFFPMTLECFAWAIPLIVFGILLGRTSNSPPELHANFAKTGQQVSSLVSQTDTPQIQVESNNNLLLDIVAGIGAGIYEELIFRLILIWLLVVLFKDLLGFSEGVAVLYAILISSFLFSLHHHFYFLDGKIVKSDQLVPIIFIFRMLAGSYLSVIFAFRGIGICAATHIYHNIIVVLLNLYVFSATL